MGYIYRSIINDEPAPKRTIPPIPLRGGARNILILYELLRTVFFYSVKRGLFGGQSKIN